MRNQPLTQPIFAVPKSWGWLGHRTGARNSKEIYTHPHPHQRKTVSRWKLRTQPTQEPTLRDAGIEKKRPLWDIKSPFSTQKQTERGAAGIEDASSYSLAGFFAANAGRRFLPKISMPKISMPKISMPKLPAIALGRRHDPKQQLPLLGNHNGGNYGATGIKNPTANPINGGKLTTTLLI